MQLIKRLFGGNSFERQSSVNIIDYDSKAQLIEGEIIRMVDISGLDSNPKVANMINETKYFGEWLDRYKPEMSMSKFYESWSKHTDDFWMLMKEYVDDQRGPGYERGGVILLDIEQKSNKQAKVVGYLPGVSNGNGDVMLAVLAECDLKLPSEKSSNANNVWSNVDLINGNNHNQVMIEAAKASLTEIADRGGKQITSQEIIDCQREVADASNIRSLAIAGYDLITNQQPTVRMVDTWLGKIESIMVGGGVRLMDLGGLGRWRIGDEVSFFTTTDNTNPKGYYISLVDEENRQKLRMRLSNPPGIELWDKTNNQWFDLGKNDMRLIQINAWLELLQKNPNYCLGEACEIKSDQIKTELCDTDEVKEQIKQKGVDVDKAKVMHVELAINGEMDGEYEVIVDGDKVIVVNQVIEERLVAVDPSSVNTSWVENATLVLMGRLKLNSHDFPGLKASEDNSQPVLITPENCGQFNQEISLQTYDVWLKHKLESINLGKVPDTVKISLHKLMLEIKVGTLTELENRCMQIVDWRLRGDDLEFLIERRFGKIHQQYLLTVSDEGKFLVQRLSAKEMNPYRNIWSLAQRAENHKEIVDAPKPEAFMVERVIFSGGLLPESKMRDWVEKETKNDPEMIGITDVDDGRRLIIHNGRYRLEGCKPKAIQIRDRKSPRWQWDLWRGDVYLGSIGISSQGNYFYFQQNNFVANVDDDETSKAMIEGMINGMVNYGPAMFAGGSLNADNGRVSYANAVRWWWQQANKHLIQSN